MCFQLTVSAILYAKCSRKKKQFRSVLSYEQGCSGGEGVGAAFPYLFHVLL